MKTFIDAFNKTFTDAEMVSKVREIQDAENGQPLVIQRLFFDSWEGSKRLQYNRVSIRTAGKTAEHIIKVLPSKAVADHLVNTLRQELKSKQTLQNRQDHHHDETDSFCPMAV